MIDTTCRQDTLSRPNGTLASIAMEAGLPYASTFKPNERNLRKNNILFHDGDDVNYIYEILSGTVKTTKMLMDGRQQVIGFFGRGDVIGVPFETSAICSAEAVTDANILYYPIVQVENQMACSPKFSKAMLKLVHNELTESVDHMVSLGRKRPAERVASFLLKRQNKPTVGMLNNSYIELPMSRTDIADYLGLTQETVCRVLSQFRRTGLINATHSHEVKIRNLSSLEAAAEVGALH